MLKREYIQNLPFCYFPTTTLFIDDDKDFLSILKAGLKKEFPCIFSVDANLNLLEDNNVNFVKYLHRDDCDLFSSYEKIYDDNRFAGISTVVLDYNMSTDGLELSKQIRRNCSYIKIIMLTGEADENLAIEAFNEGLIDKFIRKSSTTFFNEIKRYICKFNIEFFDISRRKLPLENSGLIDILHNEVYLDFIVKQYNEFQAVEFYILNETGSCLLLDTKANLRWIIFATETTLADFCDIAEQNEAEHDILDSLKTKQKIPFFLASSDKETPVDKWRDYMLPISNKINLIPEDAYFSIIDGKHFKVGNIVSFSDYLSNHPSY